MARCRVLEQRGREVMDKDQLHGPKTVLETLTHGHFKKSVGKWNDNIGLSAKCFLKSMHSFLNPMHFP